MSDISHYPVPPGPPRCEQRKRARLVSGIGWVLGAPFIPASYCIELSDDQEHPVPAFGWIIVGLLLTAAGMIVWLFLAFLGVALTVGLVTR